MGGQVAFAAAVLHGIGAPVTKANVAGFIGWAKAEGGSNWARNNPLNTTEPLGASSVFNSAGVRGYPNMQAGVRATVRTLLNGSYGGILHAFRTNNVHALPGAIGSSPWGTNGATAAQTIAATLHQGVGSLGGGGGAGVSLGSPQAQGSPPGVFSVQTPTFNQQGFQQARDRYIAGSFLAKEATQNPWGSMGGSSALGSLFKAGALTTTPPNRADFSGTKTQIFSTAQNRLQKIAGAPLNVHPGAVGKFSGYVNPIGGFQIGRTDMGVDASAAPGTPIRAIGESRVVAIRPNWYNGQPYLQMQLLNGPKRGAYYYVAEQIVPGVHPGQIVHAGETIARYAGHGTGIEIGWGSSGWQTEAQAQGNTGGPGHSNSPAGINFRQFLNSLGA